MERQLPMRHFWRSSSDRDIILFSRRPRSITCALPARAGRRSAILSIGCLAFAALAAGAGTDALNFNNNWFGPIDFVAAGVGTRGLGVNGYATGIVNIPALPAGAVPITAYL